MLHSQFLDFWISSWTLTLVVTSSFRNKTALHSSSRHHHVIIISSLESYRGELCNKLWPEFFHEIFGKFVAKLLFHFLIATLPCQIHCCVATPVDGGWTNVSISTCIDQGLDDPGVASLLRPPRSVGRYDFGASQVVIYWKKICPKRIKYSNFFGGDLSFWNHLKKLSNYTFSRVTYIRSKNPGKSQPKSSLFHKKAWRSTSLNRPSGCSDGYGCKTVNIKGGQTRPALTPCKQSGRDMDKTRIR